MILAPLIRRLLIVILCFLVFLLVGCTSNGLDSIKDLFGGSDNNSEDYNLPSISRQSYADILPINLKWSSIIQGTSDDLKEESTTNVKKESNKPASTSKPSSTSTTEPTQPAQPYQPAIEPPSDDWVFTY